MAIDSLSVFFLGAGIVVMLWGLVVCLRMKRLFPAELLRKWSDMTILVAAFCLSYIIYLGIIVSRIEHSLELVAGSIFLAGGLFVVLVGNLVKSTIEQLETNRQQVDLAGAELIRKNDQLEAEARERNELAEELRQSKTYFENIFNSTVPMSITSIDHELVMANRSYYDIFGRLSADGTVKCYESRPGPFCHTPRCPLERVLHGEDEVHCESSKEKPDGSIYHFLIMGRPFRDADGELVGILESFLDITERRQAEEDLRLSEARFRSVFDNAVLGITISDLDGHLVTANPAYQKMLGYSAEELVGQTFAQITHPEDVAKHQGLFGELLAGKRSYFQAEKRYWRRDRSVLWGRLTVSLVRDAAGKPLFVIGMVEDIRERKQLEVEQLKADKLESIGILAGGIAHDFNNLLTAILGNISLTKMLVEPNSNVAKRLLESENAVLRARSLTQQLLTFSKGGQPIKKILDVGSTVREFTSFALHGSSIDTVFCLPEDLWTIEADQGQFSQVIQNLVINASQSMAEGGIITVAARNVEVNQSVNLPLPPGKYVEIAIKDQGSGISEEYVDRIFDPYFSSKKEGSGLGLAVVHNIIISHGGHIGVKSSPGVGSVFTFYLPASDKECSVPACGERTLYAGFGRILVMDDEEMIREFTSDLLEQIGYKVTSARDGNEAVQLYIQAMEDGKPFEAVLLDLTIPGGMGGKETIQKLRQLDPKVKAIVSSGYATDSIMANYEDYGFKAVVPKPYQVEELSEALHRLLA